jgi:hypothetical protein
VWHELVLHGIGGCTIREAKERLTYDEAMSWFAYMQKRGSLNVGQRIEAATAVLSTQVNRALGGKAEITDFMPHWDQPEGNLDDVLKVFGGVKNGTG